jgi:hypothetical protein
MTSLQAARRTDLKKIAFRHITNIVDIRRERIALGCRRLVLRWRPVGPVDDGFRQWSIFRCVTPRDTEVSQIVL